MAHAYYLAGDSYPGDCHVEAALSGRLRRAGVVMASQEEVTSLSGLERRRHAPAERAAQLARVIARTGGPELPFLIGRSSGALTATLAALQQPVAGVVCLGYPFRAPGRVLAPARFAHLAQLQTRTLIVQGERDHYGGRTVTQDYALSPAISLRFAPTDHRFELRAPDWDELARWILDFISGESGETAPAGERFDEAWYLAAHPDVAAAVEQGAFASGADHFRRVGRSEGRKYRLAPAGADLAAAS